MRLARQLVLVAEQVGRREAKARMSGYGRCMRSKSKSIAKSVFTEHASYRSCGCGAWHPR